MAALLNASGTRPNSCQVGGAVFSIADFSFVAARRLRIQPC